MLTQAAPHSVSPLGQTVPDEPLEPLPEELVPLPELPPEDEEEDDAARPLVLLEVVEPAPLVPPLVVEPAPDVELPPDPPLELLPPDGLVTGETVGQPASANAARAAHAEELARFLLVICLSLQMPRREAAGACPLLGPSWMLPAGGFRPILGKTVHGPRAARRGSCRRGTMRRAQRREGAGAPLDHCRNSPLHHPLLNRIAGVI